MTRFWTWILLNSGGAVAAFFGLCTRDTAVAAAFFTGVALAIHALFGGDA